MLIYIFYNEHHSAIFSPAGMLDYTHYRVLKENFESKRMEEKHST